MLSRLREVFASLEQNDVRYLVVGGVAANAYGLSRSTTDLDILIEANEPNAQRLINALSAADFSTAGLATAEGILANDLTSFRDYLRLDVLTQTPGIDFESAWLRKQVMTYRSQQFFIVALQDLIASKEAAGRTIDLEDVQVLRMWLSEP